MVKRHTQTAPPLIWLRDGLLSSLSNLIFQDVKNCPETNILVRGNPHTMRTPYIFGLNENSYFSKMVKNYLALLWGIGDEVVRAVCNSKAVTFLVG